MDAASRGRGPEARPHQAGGGAAGGGRTHRQAQALLADSAARLPPPPPPHILPFVWGLCKVTLRLSYEVLSYQITLLQPLVGDGRDAAPGGGIHKWPVPVGVGVQARWGRLQGHARMPSWQGKSESPTQSWGSTQGNSRPVAMGRERAMQHTHACALRANGCCIGSRRGKGWQGELARSWRKQCDPERQPH